MTHFQPRKQNLDSLLIDLIVKNEKIKGTKRLLSS